MSRSVQLMALAQLKPAVGNPKRHAGAAINASISRFGLGELPMLDERTGRLVAGHGRLEQLTAMQHAGAKPPDGVKIAVGGDWLVPVLRGWSSASDAEAQAYLVTSNQLTIAGGWDEAVLAQLLSDLDKQDRSLLDVLGLPDAEIDRLLAAAAGGQTEGEGEGGGPPAAAEAAAGAVTRRGDLWLVGEHRLMCGDCRDPADMQVLLAGARPKVVFTSPPYASQRTYDEQSGFEPIPPKRYVEWFGVLAALMADALHPNGSMFVNIKEHAEGGQRDLYVYDLLIALVRQWQWRWVDELCWYDAGDGMPGVWPDRFKDAWERVYHLTRGQKITFNPMANAHHTGRAFKYSPETNIVLRPNGYQEGEDAVKSEGLSRPSNVIKIKAGREAGWEHSAAFPKQLPAWFIRAYSDRGDHVLDPFSGSGTTAAAAQDNGRIALGMELSPGYVDTSLRRLQTLTGIEPVLHATGDAHDFLTG